MNLYSHQRKSIEFHYLTLRKTTKSQDVPYPLSKKRISVVSSLMISNRGRLRSWRKSVGLKRGKDKSDKRS